MRTGLIARKLGMSRFFDGQGNNVPVTVLQLEGCQVVGQRTREKDGYTALQLGAGKPKVKNVTKPLRGHYAKAKVEPKRKLAEFRVSDDALVEVGAEFSAGHFVAGQYVDVIGTSIGKGFAGVMKRHGFSGLRASHGVSIKHRSQGSTGHSQDPGKVFKGKKMAGQMGDRRVTTQNLMIVSTDEARGLIMIKGAVPGSADSWVMVSDAIKRQLPEGVPFPAGLRSGGAASKADDPAEAAPAEEVPVDAAAVEEAATEQATGEDVPAEDAPVAEDDAAQKKDD